MSNYEINWSFLKSIYVTDAKDESDAIAKSKAFLLNMLNQIEDNQALVSDWMKVKVTKVGE